MRVSVPSEMSPFIVFDLLGINIDSSPTSTMIVTEYISVDLSRYAMDGYRPILLRDCALFGHIITTTAFVVGADDDGSSITVTTVCGGYTASCEVAVTATDQNQEEESTMLVTLDEAKQYLRVDTSDEDAIISGILSSASRLCVDVARLSDEQWSDVNSDASQSERYTAVELTAARETMRVAVFYAVGYLFEHREEADHHQLTLTLRSLLFALREGVV